MGLSLEKLSKIWVLKLSPTKVHFIVSKPETNSGIQVWSQIAADAIFEDYRIESANNNEIWLELAGEHFVRGLKSTQNAPEVTMKLTKKENLPVLSLNITSQSRNGKRICLVQDIPVRVLSPQQANDLKEPMVPEPQ
ncbi:hypothetical protein HK102_007012, partial [Quaeritorhiza haematococci]